MFIEISNDVDRNELINFQWLIYYLRNEDILYSFIHYQELYVKVIPKMNKDNISRSWQS